MKDARATLRSALLFAGGYIVISGAYILISGHLAASRARAVTDLATAEMAKGMVFVITTGLLLFAGAALILRRLQRYTEESARSRHALVVAQREAQTGILAATLGHDLNNLLAVLLGGIYEMEGLLAGKGKKILQDMSAAADQCTRIVRQLSRPRSGLDYEVAKTVEVAADVERTVSFLRYHTRARRAASLTCETRSRPAIVGNDLLIEQLTTNLVLNALDAAGERAAVRVVVTEELGAAVIEVHDNGPGIPPERREEIFTAYLTSKKTGSGLGLLSARIAAEAHDGTIQVVDSPDGGACFRVHLFSLPRPSSLEPHTAVTSSAAP